MNELAIEWSETPEEQRTHDDKGEWLQWKGTANGEETTALLHDEVVEDKCDPAEFYDVETSSSTKEPLNSKNASRCLDKAAGKIREHYTKTGKVLRRVQVVPSDFGPKRKGPF